MRRITDGQGVQGPLYTIMHSGFANTFRTGFVNGLGAWRILGLRLDRDSFSKLYKAYRDVHEPTGWFPGAMARYQLTYKGTNQIRRQLRWPNTAIEELE